MSSITTSCDAGVFGEETVAGGHQFDEWQPSESPLPRPLADYDAVISFGGGMQADEDERYPWMRTALDVLQDERWRVKSRPSVVCLGGQMLARAAGGAVGPAPQAEAGFDEVELTDDGRRDPLFAGLPPTVARLPMALVLVRAPPAGGGAGLQSGLPAGVPRRPPGVGAAVASGGDRRARR